MYADVTLDTAVTGGNISVHFYKNGVDYIDYNNVSHVITSGQHERVYWGNSDKYDYVNCDATDYIEIVLRASISPALSPSGINAVVSLYGMSY
jgi:hypothetical protein